MQKSILFITMKKMKLNNRGVYFVFSILFLIVLNSCKNEPSTTDEFNFSPSKREAFLVFFDFTQSADTSVINDIIDTKFRQLSSQLPFGGEMFCQVITNIENKDYVVKYKKPTVKDIKITGDVITDDIEISERENIITKISSQEDSIIDILKEEYKKFLLVDNARPEGRTQHPSCLIKTLSVANNFFNSLFNNDTSKYNFRLIYFSDMIEQCENYFGYTTMCGGYIHSKMNEIESKYEPNINLKNTLSDNVYFILTQKNIKANTVCFNNHDLQKIWSKVFSKVGYNEEEFFELKFGVEIPRITEFNINNYIPQRNELN